MRGVKGTDLNNVLKNRKIRAKNKGDYGPNFLMCEKRSLTQLWAVGYGRVDDDDATENVSVFYYSQV